MEYCKNNLLFQTTKQFRMLYYSKRGFQPHSSLSFCTRTLGLDNPQGQLSLQLVNMQMSCCSSSSSENYLAIASSHVTPANCRR
jgi:hypothetical protein